MFRQLVSIVPDDEEAPEQVSFVQNKKMLGLCACTIKLTDEN